MSRTAIVIILVILVGGVALLLRQSAPIQESLTRAGQVSLTGYRDDGRLSWSIQAENGFLDDDVSTLEIVKLTLLEQGNTIIVYGDRLSRDSSGSSLAGSVQIEQADGLSLSTESLFWDEDNDVLESGPVTIELDTASITAGGFHHKLTTGFTTLTQGIEAQISHDDVSYSAQSNSAEVVSDQLALVGDVSIQTENADNYLCQRLESDTTTSSIRLLGDVTGLWQGNDFSAESVSLETDGIRLEGNVIIDLDLLMMDDSHDT